LRGDGELDLLIGQVAGGLRFYTRAIHIPIGVPESKPLVDRLHLFPNPAREFLTIELSANYNSDVDLEIVDLLGQRVAIQQDKLVEGPNLLRVNLSSLAAGIYFLQVNSGKATVSRKFVVSHGQ